MGKIWLQRDTAKWNYYAYSFRADSALEISMLYITTVMGLRARVLDREVLSWRDISGFPASGKVHSILCRFTFITAIRIHKLWFNTGLQMLFIMMTTCSHHTADCHKVLANMVIGYIYLYRLKDSLTAMIYLIMLSLLEK